MKQNDAASAMRKYLWLRTAVLFSYLFLYYILAECWAAYSDSLLLLLLLVAGIVLLARKTSPAILGYLYKRTLYPFLYGEMDPAKYREAISCNKWHVPYEWELIVAAVHGGDGTESVSRITKALQKKISVNNKLFYLSLLAQVYFHADDKEKLEAVCHAFDQTRLRCRNPEKQRRDHPMFGFYRLFLEGDYAGCLEYPDMLLSKLKFSDPAYSFARIKDIYARAFVMFKAGNYSGAKSGFTEVTETAPKMYIGQLAQKYLTAMETGEEVNHPEILPDADFAVYTPAQKKKIRWQKGILNTLLALAIALVLVSVVRGFLSAPLYGWVFTEDDCAAIFQLSAEELLAEDPEKHGLPADFFEECSIEENGNLFLWLSKKQLSALRHSPLLTSSGNPRVEISPDGREVVVHAYRETIHEDIHEAFQNIYKKALLMQELDRIPGEDWEIVFIVRDGVTGEEYYRNLWPEERKEFYPEDYPLHALPQ